MSPKKVLILHENIGFGHTKVAEVIRDGLKRKYPNIQIKYTEILGKEHPFIKKFITDIYFSMVRNFPTLWEFLHQNKSSYSGNRLFIDLLINLIKPSFRKVLD